MAKYLQGRIQRIPTPLVFTTNIYMYIYYYPVYKSKVLVISYHITT